MTHRTRTRTDELLDVLKSERRRDPSGGWITAHRVKSIAGDNHGARIDELRADGWRITATRRGASAMSYYRLESFDKGQPREQRLAFHLAPEHIAALARGELPEEVIDAARKIFPSQQRRLF
jgi:hypothetical protein